MKKSVVILTILLIASIAGTYAVYELYVKQRMQELAAHLEQERQLHSKITSLSDQFYSTEPPVVLEEWRRSTQPWSDAVDARTRFYTLGRFVEEVKIPQEVIPRFFYRDELPKRIQSLQDYADQRNVQLSDVGCGVPPADSYRAGSNPPRREISDHLQDYDYCAALTRMLIDAGPQTIQPLSIWPEREVNIKSRGIIKEKSTGVVMDIRMQQLARLLESLVQADRFFRVDTLRIANTNLNDPDPLLNVSLIITQTSFEPEVQQTTGTQAAAAGDVSSQERMMELFGPSARMRRTADDDEREAQSAWHRFRRRFLPF